MEMENEKKLNKIQNQSFRCLENEETIRFHGEKNIRFSDKIQNIDWHFS